MFHWRYHLGKFISSAGYRLLREDRVPRCTANLFRLGAELAFAVQPANHSLVIVQVGAFDGRFADGLEPLLNRAGNYRALLVEPQQAPFEAMRKHYSGRSDLLFSNVAVTAKDGEVVLYTSPDGASPFASILPGHRGHVARTAGAVREVRVPGVTARKLLEMHGLAAPSLLMVDTEGFDFEVIRQFLAIGVPPPLVIQLESYHLSRKDREALRILLQENSYTYVDAEHDTVCFHKRLFSAQSEHCGFC